MRIGVIGGGAIGLLLASLLKQTGYSPVLYVRTEAQKNEINEKGILYLPGEITSYVYAEHIKDLSQMDIYFICVKQHDICSVNSRLSGLSGTVIYLQNGMGHVDMLHNMTEEQTIVLGTCEHGAKKRDQRTVIHTGKGKINLALYNGNAALLTRYKEVLNDKRFPVEQVADWGIMLIDKLMINIVINPITALFQVKNGELLTNTHLHKLAKVVCSEACAVLEVNEQQQWKRITYIIEQTKENDSSMKEDIALGRQSEVEGILGYVLKKTSHQSSVIHFLYLSIKALEEKRG
ncbi:2-dehydropantoate 2-reductase [Paraliobacillus salinarum]|uniref:2-dehydropantoate 2-reductase n=1 Tax=Paraliobacillus salinarum TaxID=1158996 RepID=UPI0015F61506|nr:2-dehydropantoate 2-reductase [Paraliobacillus salinarum]